MRLFIDDGWTQDGVVAARPGIHPALKFSYRPALAERVHRYLTEVGKGGEAGYKARVELLAEHLVGWDAAGADGQPVPLTEATLRRLRYQVQSDVSDAIAGYTAGGAEEAAEKN